MSSKIARATWKGAVLAESDDFVVVESNVYFPEKDVDRRFLRPSEAHTVCGGAGRVPDIDGLGLEEAGVLHDRAGIVVNEHLQSPSNPIVYAAGDCAKSGPPLTPVAGLEARVVAANLLGGNARRIEYPPIPSVVFTLPPLAAVGMRENEARARGLSFETNHGRTAAWYSSRRVAEEHSAYKVLVDKESGRILGAHLLGPHADELVNVIALAMRAGMTAADVKKSIFAYPTAASDLMYML